MKCLHVYRTYYPDPPGGLQEAIRQIALSLKLNSVESIIFTLSLNPYPEKIERIEADVVRSRSWASPASCDIGGADSLRKFSELSKCVDIIHYHFPWPFADLLHLIARPSVPAVMTYHSDIVRQHWLGKAYAPLMQRMLGCMSSIVVTSPAYAQTSPVLASVRNRDLIRVIPLGIDEHSYPDNGDPGVLKRLGLEESEPYFLFIGVLRYYKGLHTLIQAAANVKAKVVIAGTGPEFTALKAQIRQLRLHNVVFAGQVSDAEKVTLLKRCRALVLPSHLRSEAYGMVLVEASMFCKPIVSCEIGTGTSFVNLHGETGFVVPPESPAALAYAMNDLLNDEALAEKFGRAARRRYEAQFSGPALGKAYAQLYRDVLKNRP